MNNIENIYTGYYDNVELTEEDIEHLITEDLDEYIRLAPVVQLVRMRPCQG